LQAEKTKLLSINKLSKSYKEVQALDNITLNVYENEVYGFIGRNGAGKTTTISIILSHLKQDEGIIIFDGQTLDFKDVSYKKKIGFVPDVPSFPAYLTAYEFLKLSAEFMKINADLIDGKIKEILSFINLRDVNQKIGGYSRGMRQRLAIGSALLHEPKILIMDEPTSALDPLGRKEVLDMITTLKDKMTIFYSTHILEDAEKVCDRIGLIDKGKLIVESETKALLNNIETERYFIVLDTTDDETEKTLKAFKGLDNIQSLKIGFAFEFKPNIKQFDLFNYLNDKNQTILAFKKQNKSLEDIFLEVTHEDIA